MTTKTTRILSIALQALPLLMVTMSGVMKTIGAKELVENMTKGGFGNYILLFGLIELAAVGLMLFRQTYKTGFLLLCCYLGGALAVELSAGKFPTAALLLVLLWIGVYLRNPTMFKAIPVES